MGLIISFATSISLNLYSVMKPNFELLILTVLLLPSVGAIDWFLQETTKYKSNNFRRSWTGFLAGISAGISLFYIVFTFV